MSNKMEMEDVLQRMDNEEQVSYQGKLVEIIGINKMNNTATVNLGMVGKDVKVSELDDLH